DHHHHQGSDAGEPADALDDALIEPVRRRTMLRLALLDLRHARSDYLELRMFLSANQGPLRRNMRYRPSAARTLASASTLSGPRDFAHSSQYGVIAVTARALSSVVALVKV